MNAFQTDHKPKFTHANKRKSLVSVVSWKTCGNRKILSMPSNAEVIAKPNGTGMSAPMLKD
jgi:hypothetical protein